MQTLHSTMVSVAGTDDSMQGIWGHAKLYSAVRLINRAAGLISNERMIMRP